MRAYHERSPRTGTVFQCDYCKKFFDAEKTSPEVAANHEEKCRVEVKESLRVEHLNDYAMRVLSDDEEGWITSEVDDSMVDSHIATITYVPEKPAIPEDIEKILVTEEMHGPRRITMRRKPEPGSGPQSFRVEFTIHGMVMGPDDKPIEQNIKRILKERLEGAPPEYSFEKTGNGCSIEGINVNEV